MTGDGRLSLSSGLCRNTDGTSFTGQSAIFIDVDFSVNRDQEREDVSVEVPAKELMLAWKLLELRIGRAEFFLFAVLVVKVANNLQYGPASSIRLPCQLGNRCLARAHPIDDLSHLLIHCHAPVVADDLPDMVNRDRRLGPAAAPGLHLVGFDREPSCYLRGRHRPAKQREVGVLAYPHELDHSVGSRSWGHRRTSLEGFEYRCIEQSGGPQDRSFAWLPSGGPEHNWEVDAVDVQANLRLLLNEWDPLGVADLAPDECDCMIAPLLSRLVRGEGRSEISEFLWYELEDHFGIDPAARDVDGMANRLVAWWATVGPGLEW